MTRIFVLTASLMFMVSCIKPQATERASHENQFDKLLAYLEDNGDYINSSDMPSILNATAVFLKLNNNTLIIDIRDKEDFDSGHIRHAVHVKPGNLLSYFEDKIEPSGFESIVLVCNTGVLSSYVTALFRLLGYDNVFSMGFGLSSWDREIAEKNWLSFLSSQLVEDLEETPHDVKPGKEKPFTDSRERLPYNILRARVMELLSEDFDNVFVDPDELLAEYDKYFIVTFRSKSLYDHSHLKGSVHFAPGVALKSSEQLFNIPVGKPVVLYCNRGHTSAFGAAYLRVLGYDTYSIRYGASSFMFDTMMELIPGRVYSEQSISNYPLVKEGESVSPMEGPSVQPLPEIQGGC